MPRYIDADKLHENIVNGSGTALQKFFADCCVAAEPTVDVVPRAEGEWAFAGYSLRGERAYKCNLCSFAVANIDDVGMKFCPNCGAKMKGANT